MRFKARTSRRVGVVLGVVAALAAVSVGGAAAALAINSNSSHTSKVTLSPPSAAPHRAIPAPLPASTTPTAPPPASTTPTTTPPPSTTPTATASRLISDTCLYSHAANDDPILQPGQPGESMAHDFFGNTSTSAASTAATLVDGTTTCSTSADASAYWTPVLYQNGAAITPTRNLIYWAGLRALNPVATAPPAGLQLIAGNENAMTPQSTKVVGWRCTGQLTQSFSAAPVDCPGTKGLELRVVFPSCWNGSTLSGATQTNAAYPVNRNRCPTGYPVRIPTVVFHVVYPITSAAGLTLSMGPGQQGSVDTAHGDFINGWNQNVLTTLVNGCAGSLQTCGHVSGSDAQVRPHQAAPTA